MNISFSNYTISKKLFLMLIPFLLSAILPQIASAQSPTLSEHMQAIAHIAQEGAHAAQAGDITGAEKEYTELHDLWGTFEDDLKAQNADAYLEMEDKLHAVRDTLAVKPVDAPTLYEAFEDLEHESADIAGLIADGTTGTNATAATPASVLEDLRVLENTLANGDISAAQAQLNAVRLAWLSIEGDVATRSAEAYTAIENDLSAANSALTATPADTAVATSAVQSVADTLAPYAITARYSMFDAAAIILREGLEALLVLVALLAFLSRSGNHHRRGWIWAGAGAGILASIGTAIALQAVFNRATAGQNREIIEGATGLIAAALLFYVSYWLHRKSNVAAWQKYINTQTSQAIASGSMVGLATLAFLAVFREGAETTVFYLGMASSIALTDLLLGFAGGIAVLTVVAVLIIRFGMQLPMRPFFLFASALVYYLGFKFVGMGIHALQISNVLPTSAIDSLRAIPLIGLYPTWEVVATQAILLILAALVVSILSMGNKNSRPGVA